MTNKIVAVAGVGLALLLGGAGCSGAATSSNTTTPQSKMTAEAGTFNAQAMVGTWKGNITGADEITLKADGSFSSKYNGKAASNGTWKVVDKTLTLEDPDFVVNGTLEDAALSGDTFTATDKSLGDEGKETWTRVK